MKRASTRNLLIYKNRNLHPEVNRNEGKEENKELRIKVIESVCYHFSADAALSHCARFPLDSLVSARRFAGGGQADRAKGE